MLTLKTTALFATLSTMIAFLTFTNVQADDDMTAEKPAHYTIPVGIHGYSPVSYFEDGPEAGSPAFPVVHDGVTYFLTDAAQVEKFEADPETYLPAYGGWCAFGMAVEDHFAIDPTNFKIVDGRLMLFLKNADVDALELWNQQGDDDATAKADAFWNQTHGH
ncbi:MAG: YHS domain-containing (seleno)protein [Planctomycetota bacterium]